MTPPRRPFCSPKAAKGSQDARARSFGSRSRKAQWRTTGDESILDYPDGLARAWAALRNPNAGDVIVSAAPGVELADLAGRHHVGGGSHGSLDVGDSEVPALTIGVDAQIESIIDIAPAVLQHFGVEPPSYARPLARAA